MAYEHLWQNEAWRKAFLRWWDEDWSWEGLGKKHRRASLGGWPDESLATLQDVWREENAHDRLIEFGGRKWMRFHLPPFDRNGNPCPADVWNKAKNASCLDDLKARLEAAKAPDEESLKKNGLEAVADFAELSGVVFPEDFSCGGETLVADLRSVIFLGELSSTKRVLALFEGATFSGYAWFEGATFAGDAGFGGATFAGTASFGGATFSGYAGFGGATFARDAWFGGATFARDALFGDATFAGTASFDGATFSGYARFGDATFAGTASFGGATFSGYAGFGGAKFSGDAWFSGAKFSGDAGFVGAKFSGDASFEGAKFSGDASFEGATFARDAGFAGTTPFAKHTSFGSARFRRMADFSGREFKEQTDFSGARFYGVPKFHGAKLHPDTSFLNAKFPGEGCALPPLRLEWFRHEDDTSTERRAARRTRLARWKRWRGRIGPRRWRSRPWKAMRFGGVPFALRWDRKLNAVRKAHDSDAEEYEIAYRQLRRLAAEIGSIEYEGRFHALELKAHRARTDTQIPARIASWLYEKLSDYGRSMGRPLLWLAGSWLAAAVIYWWAFMPPYNADAMGLSSGTCQSMGGTREWNELLATAGREFLPSLFGMANTANRPEWLRCAEAAHPLWFFLIGAAQIVIFVACVSLFLIALRRRFQLRD